MKGRQHETSNHGIPSRRGIRRMDSFWTMGVSMNKLKVIDDCPGYMVGFRAIVDSEGYTVVSPSPMGSDWAKLLAAAPELLAMLRKLADDCNGKNLGTMKPPRWAVLCEAESLIARLSAHE